MAFPVSPTNGQETTINGITYIFSSSNNAWTRKPRQLFTVGVNAPANPAAGDQWYDTSDDILYQYLNDGTNSYWVDIRSGIFGGNAATLGETLIQGNLIPVANVVYSLGNTTNRFKDLFLSGSTIDLGGATIKTDATSGAIALIPQPTVANPNPTGIVVSPSGTVSTVSTTGGTLATNAISNSSNTAVTTNTTSFGNVTANGNVITSNVYADRFFYSNGTAFSSSSFGNTEVAGYFTSNTSGIAYRTDAINLPVGTTAQRPTTTSNGAIRYNTTLGRIEGYMPSGGWIGIVSDSYSVEYLVVAGGGGGGYDRGAGGGAGGLLTATGFTVTPTTAYTVTVGAGGNGQTGYSPSYSGNGANSIFSSFTAIGGGGALVAPGAVGSGGSGGGGYGQGPNDIGGAGTPGQGYSGGNGTSSGYRSGGGGGAGGSGGLSPSNSTAGLGGPGAVSLISGSSVTYAGGGGGGGDYGASVSGGSGGGGASGGQGQNGTAGTTNLGGGGGGGGNQPQGAGGNGGSGIVIIRYLGSQRGTGGTVTTSGGYTIHTFTGSGSFTG